MCIFLCVRVRIYISLMIICICIVTTVIFSGSVNLIPIFSPWNHYETDCICVNYFSPWVKYKKKIIGNHVKDAKPFLNVLFVHVSIRTRILPHTRLHICVCLCLCIHVFESHSCPRVFEPQTELISH